VSLPDIPSIRSRFPGLAGDWVFLENAGGSQVPRCVADAVHRYLTETYVQLGAGYARSRACTRTVEGAHEFAAVLAGTKDGVAVLGPSTTVLLNTLASCYAGVLEPGREIILARTGHEANLGCWKRLERQGCVIRWWDFDRKTFTLQPAGLQSLLNERTAIVALPHASNLLGHVVDLKEVCRLTHAVGAKVVADGVAFAPHRAVRFDEWGVDWYAWSAYKVYGPHMAVLVGRPDQMAALPGANHFFIPPGELAYKFEPGGANHEGCAGLLALGKHLAFLAGAPEDADCTRGTVEAAFARMQDLEKPLLARLLEYLGNKPGVRIIGPATAGDDRVGTVSFVHDRLPSREIAARVDRSRVALRHGHMYAYHLCEDLGLDPEDGVVRVSFVHYNTLGEIEELIGVLEGIL